MMKSILPVAILFFVSCSSTKYFVVRHAEKAAVPAGSSAMMASDPPLSEAGLARAEKLKEDLKNEKVGAIYSTNYKRTKSTAEPLSALTGVPVSVYNARTDSTNALVDRLKESKTNTLIVGHSNTVDDIVNRFTGQQSVPGDLPETEYDNLFIITKKGKKFFFERKKY